MPKDDRVFLRHIADALQRIDEFVAGVSEAEFRRVVRHETGHTLGFEHEHARARGRLVTVPKTSRRQPHVCKIPARSPIPDLQPAAEIFLKQVSGIIA